MAAKLTEGWWKTAWPSSTLPKSFEEMKKAIKAAKHRQRGLSVMDYRKALHEVLDLVEKLEKEADAQFRTAPLDKKRAKSMLADLTKLAEKELASAKPDAKPIVVFNNALGVQIVEKVKDPDPVRFIGRVSVKLELMTGLVNELRDKNAEAKLNTALNKVFDSALTSAVAMVDGFTKKRGGLLTEADRKSLVAAVNAVAKQIAEDLRQVPGEVLRKIGIDAKVAKAYKIDKVKSTALTVAGGATAVAGVALPGTTAFAVAALARSLLSISKEIQAAVTSVESKIQDFEADLVLLKTAFSDKTGRSVEMSKDQKWAELSFSAMNTLVGRDIMVTVKSAKANLKQIEGKVAVLSVKTLEFQKKVLEAISKTDKMKKDTHKAIGPKKIKTALANLDKAEKALNAVLDNTHKRVARVNDLEDAVVGLRRQMKVLNDPGKTIKNLQTAVDLSINFALAGGGVYDAVAWKAGDSVLNAMAATYVEMGNALDEYS
ncbi:MAG: hypothetical protein QNK42_10425 [Pseudodonghicola sp.]|nr:hypothetical protein [Pseudodonghicola sp.]